MNKTANVKKAVSIMAEQIEDIKRMEITLHLNVPHWSDEQIERLSKRISRCMTRHYNQGNAFAMLFNASYAELERAALDSIGYEHIESEQYLWEHAIY